MGAIWIDIGTVTVFLGLAAILFGRGFAYLTHCDAEEARRSRQDACTFHHWVRRDPGGLICRLCEKIPG